MTLADLLWLKFTILLIISKLPSTQQFRNDNIVFNYNNTYKYNVVYEVSVNKHTEYIMEFAGDLEVYDTPARVTIASDFANRTYPLFITARQQKGVFSWQLPMLVQTPSSLEQFTNISRTLCPHNNLFDEHQDNCDISTQNTPIVHLTSASPDDIIVTILVETVKDFYIQLDTLTNLTSTPSQPKYYFYPFKQEPHRTDLDLDAQAAKRKYICNKDLQDVEKRRLNAYFERSSASERDERSWFWKPKSVILMIESDDDICAVVSIQNFTCPVFDNERDILYDGFYLTMTRRGGITLTQDQFPLGFYIVFIVKSSDEACTLPVAATNASAIRLWGGDLATGEARVKNFSFTIVQTISYQEYMIAAGAALGFFLSFYLLFIAAAVAQRRARGRGRGGAGDAPEGDDLTAPVTPHDDASVSIARRRIVRAEPAMNVSVESTSRQHLIGDSHNTHTENASTDSESDFSSAEDNPSSAPDKDRHNRLCLASLAQKRASVLTRRSNMYLWNVLTVTVFYTLPVIQLVVTYQRMLNQSGNQDLCYFNFFCAHPLLFLSDFNHVYSNLGYILLGLLFLVQVWRRHSAHRMKTEQQKELGIPQHFGLLYAMGIALVSEGLLSAAYHVCPNSMNFQFDTSFMYVTGVLCMVKVYQSRHPDINARAHATFGVLALIIFIGLVGVLNADLYFWAGFTVLHLLTCSVMTFQIYYMGRFRLDAGVVYRAGVQLCRRPLSAVTPTHVARCVLLLTANLANWALAGYGVAQHSRDFGSHLLTVVMSNLFLYTLFYIAMKLLHKEYIRWYSWVFIALTYTTWFSSSYFFLDLSTNWALTPAQSRQSNRVCSLLQLYDSHDVWHFMSSSAMFFSFNMYLTIDDNLDGTPRDVIMVF